MNANCEDVMKATGKQPRIEEQRVDLVTWDVELEPSPGADTVTLARFTGIGAVPRTGEHLAIDERPYTVKSVEWLVYTEGQCHGPERQAIVVITVVPWEASS